MRLDEVTKTIKDLKAQGFYLPSLSPGTRILAESTIGTLYSIQVMDKDFIEFYSTDPIFRQQPPKFSFFVASWTDKTGSIAVPGWVFKLGRMLITFADGNFLTEPVVSARLEGAGWHYEAIE